MGGWKLFAANYEFGSTLTDELAELDPKKLPIISRQNFSSLETSLLIPRITGISHKVL